MIIEDSFQQIPDSELCSLHLSGSGIHDLGQIIFSCTIWLFHFIL